MAAYQTSVKRSNHTDRELDVVGASFLHLPSNLRHCIYFLAELPHDAAIYLDAPWRNRTQQICRMSGPEEAEEGQQKVDPSMPGLACLRCLMLTCRTVSSEVANLFYSRNTFITRDLRPLKMFRKVALQSLRNLRVVIYSAKTKKDHGCVEHYPVAMTKDEARSAVSTWKLDAEFLGRNVSPGRLNLSIVCDVAYRGKMEERMAAAQEVLGTLAYFPPLATCEVCLGHRPSKTINEMARVACERSMVQHDVGPFRFMDLPTEIRLRVLEHTDIVAPVPSLSWDRDVKYRLPTGINDAAADRGSLLRKPHCGLYGVGCFCSSFHAGYSPSCGCWQNPQSLFLVNKALLAEARDVFFRSHHFEVVDPVRRHTRKVYPGICYFKDGILPGRIQFLQSLHIHARMTFLEEKDNLDWLNTIQRIREDGGLNLRFLRLGVLCPENPRDEEMMRWAAEGKIDAFRSVVHERFWPLDTGETACLPFGTQNFECRFSALINTADYRMRRAGKPPKSAWGLGLIGAGTLPSASRVLVGGDIRTTLVEQHAVEETSGSDWVEELWSHDQHTILDLITDKEWR